MAVVLDPIIWNGTPVKALNKYNVHCDMLGDMPINDWWGAKKEFLRKLEKGGYPKNTDRSWIISERDPDGKLIGLTIMHESDLRQR